MISTRRIATVLAVAAGVSGLAASAANAAGPLDRMVPQVNPVSQLDALSTRGIPAEYRAEFPTASNQMAGLKHLNDLGQLHQVTDQAAPVANLVPAVH
ncbi:MULTISPECIES: hypothetical protein [unclassified Streptomyces]|uniref:hypothetical protein n=1 Tax=unclassified Streptomyces TaxID=2593676 RepID=UPI00382AFEC9